MTLDCFKPGVNFLKNPYLQYSDKTVRIRRNLLIIFVLAYFLMVVGVDIENIHLGVVKVQLLQIKPVVSLLLVINVYQLFYFLWCSWDEYWKHRLGLIKEIVGHYQDRDTDELTLSAAMKCTDSDLQFHPDYRYMDQRLTNAINQIVSRLEQDIEKEDVARRAVNAFNNNIGSIIKNDVARLVMFENSFKYYHWQEIARFFIIEFGLPVVVSIYSIYLLLGFEGAN